MVLNLVEELAARAFNATYRLSINRLRSARAALILAYTGYYATMCILLALIAFAAMAATSAILMICFPELYYKLAEEAQWIPPIHHLFFMFGAVAWKEVNPKKNTWRREIREVYEEYESAFEETGLLKEFVAVLDRINSTLAAVERCRPPSIIARTLVYDDLSMLDDFAREYRGYVGRVMDYVCMELRSLLYEVLEEGGDFGGERRCRLRR
jgi:hypothetical protein